MPVPGPGKSTQSKDCDAGGAYVRTWLSELARVLVAFVHQPWEMSRAMQQHAGTDYPAPPPSALGG
jgi:deoxyribodipyrimidine photolyase